jgi:hypothetical protein
MASRMHIIHHLSSERSGKPPSSHTSSTVIHPTGISIPETFTVSLAASHETTPPQESAQAAEGATAIDLPKPNGIVRRFKPQLIETSHSHGGSSRDVDSRSDSSKDTSEIAQTNTPPIRRYTPNPIESSTTSRVKPVPPSELKSESSSRRSFTPQLVETAKRSRRSTDTRPALLYADRTDVTPSLDTDDFIFYPRKSKLREELHARPSQTSILSPISSSLEARILGVPPPKRNLSQSSSHSHSFRSPGLETIESSESDSSAQASPITSSSPSPISFIHSHRTSQCVDNHSTGYLLALAAKNAQRQLREQALAAFPNDDRHQPVSHFMDRIDTPASSSRGSQYDLDIRRCSGNWELRELQKHHEMLEADREKERKRREARRKFHKQLDESPWSIPICRSRSQDAKMPESSTELRKMLEKARPPMLGKDLVFPRSQSPDPARFDVTQGPESLKRTLCYLSSQPERSERNTPSGLWSAAPTAPTAPPKPESVASYQWSRPVSRTPSQLGGGLWGGSCVDTGHAPSSGRPTGIMTPKLEEDTSSSTAIDVLSSDTIAPLFQLPPSPPASNSGGISSLDERLEIESAIEEEFDDHFVTQVYNYLSLGYPAIARDFDKELAKISRIPISELRQDDDLPTGARGYIRLGEEELCNGVTENMCTRWKALRLYVLEWARQQPKMSKAKDVEGSWAAVRKGSWAW